MSKLVLFYYSHKLESDSIKREIKQSKQTHVFVRGLVYFQNTSGICDNVCINPLYMLSFPLPSFVRAFSLCFPVLTPLPIPLFLCFFDQNPHFFFGFASSSLSLYLFDEYGQRSFSGAGEPAAAVRGPGCLQQRLALRRRSRSLRHRRAALRSLQPSGSRPVD